jgi:heme-binding protein
MRILKLILALAAAGVILGQVGTENREASKSRNKVLPHFFNSEPAQVLVRACGDCHSNHTEWPWYSHVVPLSWWITQDVNEGRRKLDFSEWETYSVGQRRDKLDSMCGVISMGRMPPRSYTAMHRKAKLADAEKKAVCDWIKEETIGASDNVGKNSMVLRP